MESSKNKKVTYLLICAVAAVWGIIIYRIFFNEVPEEEFRISNQQKQRAEPFDKYSTVNDTFKLTLNYRDPFLGKVNAAVVEHKTVIDPVVVSALPAKPVAPPMNWSIIRYSGYITNPKTNKMVAIVSVNGKERMLAEGEIFEGIKILKNKRDSILVSWLGKQKYIRQ